MDIPLRRPISARLIHDLRNVFYHLCQSLQGLNEYSRLDSDLAASLSPNAKSATSRYEACLIRVRSLHSPAIRAPTPRDLPVGSFRFGHPRRGTYLYTWAYPTLSCQIGINGAPQVIAPDPWRAYRPPCSPSMGTAHWKFSPRPRHSSGI